MVVFGSGRHRKNLTHKLKHQELPKGKVVGSFCFFGFLVFCGYLSQLFCPCGLDYLTNNKTA
jgi:hypothetical protein